MKNIFVTEHARDLVAGSWDLHIHPSPSVFPRKQDDFEIALDLSSASMGGGVIKTHYESTAGRALMANKYSGSSSTLFGSLALNYPAGGLNPHAVMSSLGLGAKIIWFPTRDARNHISFDEPSDPSLQSIGITISDVDGVIKTEVHEILDLIKSHNAVMATGHLSQEESYRLCELSVKSGVKSILTHPDWTRTRISLEDQIGFAEMGVLIEKTWQLVSTGICTEAFFCDSIRKIGPGNVILTTDSAYVDEPGPSLSCMQMVQTLLDHGFSDDEIILMNRLNPERLLFE